VTEVKRYTPSLKPGLMIEDAEGKWAKYEVLAQIVAQCEDLQQRLTAADELADLLLGLLHEARQHHGVMLMSDPPQDAWKYHRMNERIDAVLNAKP